MLPSFVEALTSEKKKTKRKSVFQGDIGRAVILSKCNSNGDQGGCAENYGSLVFCFFLNVYESTRPVSESTGLVSEFTGT
jgi:hypothetical protein